MTADDLINDLLDRLKERDAKITLLQEALSRYVEADFIALGLRAGIGGEVLENAQKVLSGYKK